MPYISRYCYILSEVISKHKNLVFLYLYDKDLISDYRLWSCVLDIPSV